MSGVPPKKIRKQEEGSDVEELSDDEFDEFLNSAEGQIGLNTDLKFAEGTQSTGKRKNVVVPVAENEDEFGKKSSIYCLK